MPPFHELQARICDTILDRDAADSVILALRDDRPVPVAQRLRIHRNNTQYGLIAPLAETFPVVAALVGEDFFAQMARAFIRALPPTRPNLFSFGQDLPGFIAAYEGARSIPYLADMARLEFALNFAYHARDETPMPAEALTRFAPETLPGLCLTTHPSLRFVISDFPLLAIWRAHQPDGDLEQKIDLAAGQDHLLVYRPRQECLIRRVSVGAFAFVMALSMGQTIEAAFGSAVTNHPDFAVSEELAALLAADLFIEAHLGA